MLLLALVLTLACFSQSTPVKGPFVINTWPFVYATDAAFEALSKGANAIDGIVEGCSNAESDPTIGSVGYGGSPSETGNVTLDAMLMDGETMNVGAVAGMPHVKDAIKVARHVLLNTKHSLLVGDAAAEFAKSCGFKHEALENDKSKGLYYDWANKKCQPNYRSGQDWTPDPKTQCGPYKITGKNQNPKETVEKRPNSINYDNHDTIGMIAIDKDGKLAAGTSTNGAIHKINGRVGDSPIPGAGAYAKSGVGAAVATGDGDIIMRYSLTFRVVLLMEQKMKPKDAIVNSLKSIKDTKGVSIALLAMDASGNYASGCTGFKTFPFSIKGLKFNKTSIITVNCT